MATMITTDALTSESLEAFHFHMNQWQIQAATARAYMDEQRRSTRNSEKWNYLDGKALQWHKYASASAAKQNTIGLILYRSGTLTSSEIANALSQAATNAQDGMKPTIDQIRKETRGMNDKA